MAVLPTLVQPNGEPFADSSAMPSYYVSKEWHFRLQDLESM
jgi:hypothetical protein